MTFNPKKKVRLPGKNEIRKRLLAVQSSATFRKRFIPLVQQHSSRTVTAQKVCDIFSRILGNWKTNGLEGERFLNSLHRNTPVFIDILVSDTGVARRAKHLFKPTLEKVRRRDRQKKIRLEHLREKLDEKIQIPTGLLLMRRLKAVSGNELLSRHYYPLITRSLAGKVMTIEQISAYFIAAYYISVKEGNLSEKAIALGKRKLRAYLRIFTDDIAVLNEQLRFARLFEEAVI